MVEVVVHQVEETFGYAELEEPMMEDIHGRVLHRRAQVTAIIDPVSRLHRIHYVGQHQWMVPTLKEPMHQSKPPQQKREVAQFRVCKNPFPGGIKLSSLTQCTATHKCHVLLAVICVRTNVMPTHHTPCTHTQAHTHAHTHIHTHTHTRT